MALNREERPRPSEDGKGRGDSVEEGRARGGER